MCGGYILDMDCTLKLFSFFFAVCVHYLRGNSICGNLQLGYLQIYMYLTRAWGFPGTEWIHVQLYTKGFYNYVWVHVVLSLSSLSFSTCTVLCKNFRKLCRIFRAHYASRKSPTLSYTCRSQRSTTHLCQQTTV